MSTRTAAAPEIIPTVTTGQVVFVSWTASVVVVVVVVIVVIVVRMIALCACQGIRRASSLWALKPATSPSPRTSGRTFTSSSSSSGSICFHSSSIISSSSAAAAAVVAAAAVHAEQSSLNGPGRCCWRRHHRCHLHSLCHRCLPTRSFNHY